MRWVDLTWPEFGRLGPDVAILWPLGSCEQHGEHLPVGTDTHITAALAERVEQKLPNRVLLMPVLWVGASHHHRAFSGTVSLPEGLYSRLLQEVVAGVVESDVCAPGRVRRILLLNGHGGNIAPGQAALAELAWRFRERTDLIMAFASYWTLCAEAIGTVRMETPTLTHACEYETSLMLAVRGELVRMDRARAHSVRWEGTRFTPDASRPSKVTVSAPFHTRSANGALGRPELATEEKGRQLFEVIAQDLVAFVGEFLAWPELADARAKGHKEV